MSTSDRAVSGAAWNLSTGVATRALGLMGTLVVTRFVSPAEYGAISAALICSLTATRALNLGLGSYIITHRSPPEVTFQAALLHVIATGAAFGGVVALREPLASLLGIPTLGAYLPGLAFATAVTQLVQVPAATLVRQLRFRGLASSRALAEVSQTLLAIALAPWVGGMALVLGNVARSIVFSALVLVRADRRTWWAPRWLEWPTARSLLAFGLPTAGASLAETATGNWDNLLVSRLFGPAVMGQYNLGYNLGTTPSAHVAEHINDVLLPSFSAVDPFRRRDALRRAVALMGLLIFPLSLGLAAISHRLIAVLLDPRWLGVAPMLAILAGISVARPLSLAVESYLRAERRPQPILVLGIARLLGMAALVYLAFPLGPLGACAAVTLAFVLHSALCLLTLAERGLAAAVLRAALPPLGAAVLMAATVWASGDLLERWRLPSLGILLAQCGTGALSYAAYAGLVARPLIREASTLLQNLFRGPARDR